MNPTFKQKIENDLIENNEKKDDKEKNKERNQNIKVIECKCKFSGIFEQDEKKKEEYRKIIKMFEDKKQNKGELELKEIEKIFIIKSEKEYTLKCQYYAKIDLISMNLEFIISTDQKEKFFFSLKKKPYEFKYNLKNFYCFIMQDMKNYLEELTKKNSFSIIIIKPNNKRNSYPYNKNIFQTINEYKFEIQIDYQYRGINFKTINYNDIYNKKIIKKGSDLNLELGLYVDINKEEYENFEYYNTNERENFIKYILNNIEMQNVVGICGPYGSGKTITLLKLIIESSNINFLYINLATVFNNDNNYDQIHGILRYELIKLFGEDIFQYEETNKKINNPKVETYIEIVKLIKKYDGFKNFFTLIASIMSLTKNILYKNQIIYFIIDQYSSKYDIDKKYINELINNTNSSIHLIICSSLNNYDIKKDFCSSFSENRMFNDNYYYIYVGNLLRLNNLENYEDIIKNETDEFKMYLNYFGNIPLYYYSLKHTQKKLKQLKYFFEEEIDKIKEDIKNFYKKEKNDESLIKMYSDIFKILQIINYKKIYFFKEFEKDIIEYPLKYLELKKEEIKISDLELYGHATDNKNIIENIENIEDIEDQKLYHLINDENYCKNYIKKINDKKREKIYKKNKNKNKNKNKTITIYYLDYLFPLMEDIFSNLIYIVILKFANNIYIELPSQSQGGLIEYVIYEKVRSSNLFINHLIKHFETIDNFVPNSFFIQNYTSRKTDTLKEYSEEDIKKSNQKKSLPRCNIFLKQKQFTGKYYDCGLLISNKDIKGYKLFLFQISKRKISSHRYFREEHQLIFNRVKKKLEDEYNIEITEGYFSYILSDEEKDTETIEFCNKNKLNYFFFFN